MVLQAEEEESPLEANDDKVALERLSLLLSSSSSSSSLSSVPSNAVVSSQVSALLADHSQRYNTSSKLCSDLFVVDANPNISVFDLLTTYSLLCVLGKHGSPLPLVVELASALFLTNGNDKVYHTFWHLEGLATLPKDNLTMYFANWCNSEFGDVFSKGSFQ
jgi:hypothetical protein